MNRQPITSLNIILMMGSSQMFIYMSNIHVYEAVKTKQWASENMGEFFLYDIYERIYGGSL